MTDTAPPQELPALAWRTKHPGHRDWMLAESEPRLIDGWNTEPLCSRTDALRLVAELRAERKQLLAGWDSYSDENHALRLRTETAERRLAKLERAQEHKVYCQCQAHQGQMWPMWKVTVAPPTRVVCPNCEAAT